MPNLISEDDIEKALLKRLQEHGFDLLNCHTADRTEIKDGSNRTDKRDVILGDRLKLAAQRLNPDIPETAIDQAVKNVMDRRIDLSAIEANCELDRLIRDGVPIQYDLPNGKQENAFVRLIDFNQTTNNHFLAVSQLWIQAQGFDARAAYRRPDVILYVNGLPLVFIELKNSTVKLRNAFDDNLTDYKRDIPQLFHCNAFCILSNAIATKVGSFTAGWEHFFSWLRVEDEKEKVNRPQIEQQGTSLEIAIAGICTPDKLLNYVENFILYHQGRQKIIAQNHQFIGVNHAFDLFAQRESRSPEERKKLGVFWHTQGSGKSFSMIFYARKVFRKLKGNYTFAIVTDRTDLDGQIYKNFLNTDTVAQNEAAQPKNSEEMRKFFGQNKRVVFTLIQKFRYDKGKTYPLLSDRDDIIVMVDEAHRTQYAALAENMRTGLPNANFMAFTGTPLLGKDRKTNEWFGDYVSEYNFQQAMDDGATVPLFYEKRVSEMMNQNENLSEEFYQLLEDEDLDEAQQAKLEQKFATEMQVIKRDDRLEAIAKDIVNHFANRGYLGKGLMVAIDKFTAVKMYDKVQQQWKGEIKNLVGKISKSDNDIEKAQLRRIVEYMRSVEMAVVISEDANEVEKFAAQGLDIKPHRDRIQRLDAQGHDLEYNFKDPEHPLQLVFVCAMWLTGFDAPTLSTLYLDKPMRGHTLMQTIARANRVASHQIAGHRGKVIEKKNGEIVDYYNVFRNMKAALKEYAQGSDGGEDAPVQEKSQLFELLDQAIAETEAFCLERAINLQQVLHTENTFKNLSQFKAYTDILLSRDEWRKSFAIYSNTVSSLYEACKPEILAQAVRPIIAAIEYLRNLIDTHTDRANIDAISIKIAELLDESLVVNNANQLTVKESSPPYQPQHQIIQSGKTWDLSKINFEKLRAEFKDVTYKHIEIADLRAFIDRKLSLMMQQNITRTDFAQRLQEIVDKYNSGSSLAENSFSELLDFVESMKIEDERHVREGLTEDELELFDIIKKDKMTKDEEQKVKLAAKSLLHRLLEAHPKVLVQDWWKDRQTQNSVRKEVEQVLDSNLPETYDRTLFTQTCDRVFNLIVDFSSQGRKWAA